MSTIKANTVTASTTNGDMLLEGNGSGVANIGDAGFKVAGTVGVPVSSIRDGTDGELITWDASGNAATVAVGSATEVLTSNGAGAAPTFQAAGGGAWTKISDITADDSSNLVFSSGIDATYPMYVWVCEDMRFVLQQTNFELHVSQDGGSSYENDTYSGFYHNGPSSGTSTTTTVEYNGNSEWTITSRLPGMGPNANGSNTDDDKPSRTISCIIYASTLPGTTYTPKYWADGVYNSYQTFTQRLLSCGGQAGAAGFSTPWDVDAVKFECSSGNIASGTITMYGVSS